MQVAQHTSTKERMSEFSMVYYNNLLSIGPILVLMAVFGEFEVRGDGDLHSSGGQGGRPFWRLRPWDQSCFMYRLP